MTFLPRLTALAWIATLATPALIGCSVGKTCNPRTGCTPDVVAGDGPPRAASPYRYEWGLDTAEDYELPEADAALASGKAALKAIEFRDADNESFNQGSFVDTIFTSASGLAPVDGKLRGTFRSRPIDATKGIDWARLSWASRRPFGRPLPDNRAQLSGYENGANIDMSGNILLLHLDEKEVSPTEYRDSSGRNHHALPMNPAPRVAGKLGSARTFHTNRKLDVATDGDTDFTFPTKMVTMMAWVSTEAVDHWRTVMSGNNWGTGIGIFYYAPYGGLCAFVGSWTNAACGAVTQSYSFTHVAATYDRVTLRLYLNGTLAAQKALANVNFSGAPFSVGATPINQYAWEGSIDEVALFNRPLSAEEIRTVYQMGAGRIKFQVRGCADASCATAGSFLGPDGTSTTFFTAMDTQSTGMPEVELPVVRSRFIQYQVTLEGDTAATVPSLQSVSVGPRYSMAGPSVASRKGPKFRELLSFDAAVSGDVAFQLSNDGTRWFWVSDGNWVTASRPAEASEAGAIASAISRFASQVGPGQLFFRAFLRSPTGATAAELENVSVTVRP